MKYLPVLLFLFLSTLGLAQESLEDLVQKGIQYHDEGEYEKAIKIYQQALKIDPNSSLVNYEMSITYFAAQKYQEALESADKIIAQGERKYLLPALVTKGSCLDNLGKSQEAIQVYEKSLNDYGGHYLLYYNLGLTQFNVGNLKAGEEAILNALKANINHSSSHLLLSYIQEQKEKKVPHLLASYYFLLLEPNSRRSPDAYAKLRKSLEGNVEKTGKKDMTINLNPSSLEDEAGFSAVELMVSLMAANNISKKNAKKSAEALFQENTTSFFKILGELRENQEEKIDNIYWAYYVPFFYELAQSAHMEAYCHLISQSTNPKSRAWLNKNQQKLDAFAEWIEQK